MKSILTKSPYFFLGFAIISLLTLTAAKAESQSKQDSNIPVSHPATQTPFPAWDDPASDPFQEMEKVQEGVNHILRESWKRMRNYQQAGKFFEPDADFVEQDGKYLLKMDLPGMQKDKINIEAVENSITVSGERQTERQTTDKEGVSQFERSSGTFYRRMTLPADADVQNIGAKYENGVLEVSIPKTTPNVTEKKKIQVQ
jgi:HSP20 family protein